MIKKEKIGRRKAERKKLKQSLVGQKLHNKKNKNIYSAQKWKKEDQQRKVYNRKEEIEGIFRRQAEKMEGERRGKKEWKENVNRKD